MGMYNELDKISKNINQQVVEYKKTQEQQKRIEFVKNELDSALYGAIMDLSPKNVFDEEVRSITIDAAFHGCNYILYNKDFTLQYLNKRYFTIARQVEQVNKRILAESDTTNDYKRQIALEKWEIQKEKELLKIRQLYNKEAEQQQKKKQENQVNYSQVLGIILTIICFPIGLLILCIFAAAGKQK